ncbi:MAG: dockerin type I repeat-containing protein [Oscillospiraceae bacterium]|nr:dockerin type I repeat-containing protein [Oscillospiraceae bacterium]
MKIPALLSALMLTAASCSALISAAVMQDAQAADGTDEPAVTTTSPVTGEYVNPRTALYGLAADTSELQMNVGNTHQLAVTWDEDCYNENTLQFRTDNADIVTVDRKTDLVQAQGGGTAVIEISASLNSKKIQWDWVDSGVRHIKVAVTVIDPALNNAQRAALRKLESIEWASELPDCGRKYPRERAVIRGEIAPDAPRLTLDEVNQIIDASASFNEVSEKIKAAQKYPDYYDRIEQTSVLYWFDNRGTEGITVDPDYEQIYYFRGDENGYPQESQLLYPERQEPVPSTYTGVDRIFRDFNEIYGGTYSQGYEPDPEPEKALYGLAMDIPADLHVGEFRQILGSWNADCYLPDPVIQSDNNDIALIYNDGHLFARKAGTTTVWIRGRLDPEKVSLSEDDDGVRTVTKTITVTDSSDLTDEQKTLLTALEERERETGDTFPRIKAELRGIPDADAPRLSLDEISQIIEASDSIEEILRKLTDAQPYPDYYGGSGFTSVLYCLNDKGTERIRVNLDCGMPAHEILYDRLDQDGILRESRYLYPELKQIDVNPNATATDWFYRTLHEIAGCIPKPGDANCDGGIDVSDAVLIARFAAEDRDAVITDQGKTNADVTGDGTVTAEDTSRILLYIAKKIGYEALTGEQP